MDLLLGRKVETELAVVVPVTPNLLPARSCAFCGTSGSILSVKQTELTQDFVQDCFLVVYLFV